MLRDMIQTKSVVLLKFIKDKTEIYAVSNRSKKNSVSSKFVIKLI